MSTPIYASQTFISKLSKPLLCSSLACVGWMLFGCVCVFKVNLCVRHLDRRTIFCDLVDWKPHRNTNNTRGEHNLTVGSNGLWKKSIHLVLVSNVVIFFSRSLAFSVCFSKLSTKVRSAYARMIWNTYDAAWLDYRTRTMGVALHSCAVCIQDCLMCLLWAWPRRLSPCQ